MTCIPKTQNRKWKQYCIKFNKDFKQVLNTIQIKEAILVSSKGLQLDKQKTCSPTPLPAFTYKNKSFFNKVRFNKDTKRETFA